MTRKPMHVDTSFEERIKKLQKQIRMKRGEDISLREITAQITKDPNFERIEQTLIENDSLDFNFKIKLDKRFLE